MRAGDSGVNGARVALELFFSIAGKLGTSAADEAALLGSSQFDIQQYRTGEALPEARDTLERISHITAIWLGLLAIFRKERDALLWLHSPNQSFGGSSPLQRILAGNVSDLVDVRYDVEEMHIR
jgi:hypothetical protein